MLRLTPFFLALALLTRLPIPRGALAHQPDARARSQSVLCYPLVGLCIGILLASIQGGLRDVFPAPVLAALLLCAWAIITGAIHLDGLADAVDAAFAAHKNPRQVRALMRDPHIGAMGTVSLVLLLILKYGALLSLSASDHMAAIAMAMAAVLARQLAVIYMLTTAYVSEHGLAAGIDIAEFRYPIYGVSAAVFLPMLCYLSPLQAIVLAASLALLLWYWRRLWIKKIAGYTGDCVGGLIELAECLVLMALAAFIA